MYNNYIYNNVLSQTAFAMFLVHSVLESASVWIDSKDGIISSQCGTIVPHCELMTLYRSRAR